MYLEEISYFMFKTVIFSVNFIFERNTFELRTVQHVISEEKTSIVQHIQYNNNAGHAPSQLNCGYDKFMAFKLAFVNVKCVLRRRALSDQCHRGAPRRHAAAAVGGTSTSSLGVRKMQHDYFSCQPVAHGSVAQENQLHTAMWLTNRSQSPRTHSFRSVIRANLKSGKQQQSH